MNLSLSYSCLIARNLMNGWKTCLDVYMYMNNTENKLFSQSGDGTKALGEGCRVDGNETTVSIFALFLSSCVIFLPYI